MSLSREFDIGYFDLPTERRLEEARDLDALTSLELVRLMHRQDRAAVAAVGPVLRQLAALVDRADLALRNGGRVHYFGAGTSGRLGVLDAVELVPTFSLEPDVVQAHLAGGAEAMFRAIENSEDSSADGHADAAVVTPADVVVGLTASGQTPYVAGALKRCRDVGAFTALITSNPRASLADVADVTLAIATGPEVLAGSTRLKAGTAEKLVLNSFSTALMVRQGRTWRGLMVSVVAANAKLRARTQRILAEAAGVDLETAARCLDAASGELKTGLVSLLGEVSPDQARSALQEANQSVRAALVKLGAGEVKPDNVVPSSN
jgi:N-acetylmuramic acid 6-phosphate etherase